MDDVVYVGPAEIRAARGLLGWSQEQLAQSANVGRSTVKDAEAGNRSPIASNVDAIRRALEAAGIKFIAGNDDDGPAVRLTGQAYLPQVIRKPTKTAPGDYLPFRVIWRNKKVIVFLSTDILKALDHTDHGTDHDAFIDSFDRHQRAILKKVATAIDEGLVDEQRSYLYLTQPCFFGLQSAPPAKVLD
jgi:transcriptional regulator with XRE-family HTH domain